VDAIKGKISIFPATKDGGSQLMKQQLPKQVYTSEYRQQAVAMITHDKLSVAEVEFYPIGAKLSS